MSENNEQKENETFTDKLKNYIKNILDFSNYDKKTLLFIVIFAGLFIVSIGMLYYIYFVDETFLFRIVVNWFVNPIILLGLLGILLFLVIMAFQGLLVPIPSEIVLLAAGMVWGWFWGGILGVAGSMLAGTLCFYVSRTGGRPLAEKFIGENALEMADDLIEKHGMLAIIVARSIPFVSFDAISYTAGLVDIEIKEYTIGTFIGSIPRAFFYSYLGSILIRHEPGKPINLKDIPIAEIDAISDAFNLILMIILVVLVIVFGLYYLTGRMYEEKRRSGKYLVNVKQIMEEKAQIKAKLIRKAILMSEEMFDKKIQEWSKKFEFKTEEGLITVNKNTLREFCTFLDDQLEEMKKLKEHETEVKRKNKLKK